MQSLDKLRQYEQELLVELQAAESRLKVVKASLAIVWVKIHDHVSYVPPPVRVKLIEFDNGKVIGLPKQYRDRQVDLDQIDLDLDI